MAQDTTDRLIATARNRFALMGFAQVSLDSLAAEAGVTRGALHHHFTNKAGLFEAVLRQIDAEIAGELSLVWQARDDSWLAFRQCFHTYLDAVLRPDRRRILFQDAPAVLGTKAVDILMESGFGAMVSDIEALIHDGRLAPVDSVALAHLLNGSIMNLAFWAAEDPGEDARLPRAHETLSAMFDGLGQPPKP
ncbi:MAG: TetR/AcrR family transcriptional regulator [Paracoccaceae bacterium]